MSSRIEVVKTLRVIPLKHIRHVITKKGLTIHTEGTDGKKDKIVLDKKLTLDLLRQMEKLKKRKSGRLNWSDPKLIDRLCR